MSDNVCPLIGSCPAFENMMFSSDVLKKAYREKYCSKSANFANCKRFIVYMKTGKQVPQYIMPNSHLTIEEIIWKIE